MKNKKLPTLFGLLILTSGIALGVVLLQNRQIFRLGAEPSAVPKDVRITNINSGSFTVTWITEEETPGFVSWAESQSLGNTAQNEVGDRSIIHSATIEGLTSETTYYFKINSAGVDFDNNGIPWQVKTAATFSDTPASFLISGVVITPSGSPAKGVLVVAQLAGASPLSSVTNEDGNWVMTLSNALSQDLKSRASYSDASTIIEISVQAGPAGVATAKIYPKDANPTPTIVLGQIHDFRNLSTSKSEELPESSLVLPEGPIPTPQGEFEPGAVDEQKPVTIEGVTIESIDEGEVVTSTDPEFFGEGPPGTTVSITVESTPVTDEITISSFGTWSWNPTQPLSEGVHKITITWKDKDGILQSLTRNFVVQAAEGPAFESTPSATTPTPTPTNTPTPSATPTPTSTIAPTQTPTPTPTLALQPSATPTPDLPESGSLTPTIAGIIMGLGFLFFSAISTFQILKETYKP